MNNVFFLKDHRLFHALIHALNSTNFYRKSVVLHNFF